MPRKKALVNLNEQIAVGYYTAQEAQRKLGMTRDMFNNHVKQGTIKKTTFVGTHGYYKKTEIDTLAEKIEALLLTARDQDLEYKTATLDDLDAEIDLAALNFGRKRAEATREARAKYLQTNSEITHYLFSQGRMVDPEGEDEAGSRASGSAVGCRFGRPGCDARSPTQQRIRIPWPARADGERRAVYSVADEDAARRLNDTRV